MTTEPAWQKYIPSFCTASPNLTQERIAIVQKTWQTLKSGKGKGVRGGLGLNPNEQDAIDLISDL